MYKWEQFTKEQLQDFVKNSTSLRQVADKCGYSQNSGNGIKSIHDMIDYYGFDTSHFFELNGRSHKEGQFDYSRFQYGKVIKPANMKAALVALRGNECECCHNTTWLDKPITLEVHHLDGDSLNNTLENLQLLCPNCHSYTDNWRGKNIDKKNNKNIIPEEKFVEALKTSVNIRQALIKLGLAPKGGNYTRANELLAKYNVRIGQDLKQ